MHVPALLGLVTLLGVALAVPDPASAAPSYLDPTFGTGGIVITPIGTDAIATAVVRQPDGALVAAGYAVVAGAQVFALARYEADGDLDPGFGTGGIVTTPIGTSAVGTALALQPDGKLVAAGWTSSGGGNSVALARYETDGSLDSGFGSGGIVVTPVGTSAIAKGIVLQDDDKIVIAGGTSTGGGAADILLVRYEADATLDSSFGTGGVVTTPIGSLGDAAHALARQADGKLLVAGTTETSASGARFAVARYDTDGTLDPSFGSGGVVTTGFGELSTALALVIQPDQKIVAGGHSLNPGFSAALARYDTGGALDPTFGSGGTIYSPGGSFVVTLQALANYPPDRLMLGGTLNTAISVHPFSTDMDFAVARLSDGHTVDFSTSTELGSLQDSLGALVVQPDEKVVGAGTSADAFALARYLIAVCGDGNLEPGEPCDDGNLESGDGCDANCTPTGCGNAIVTAGETCDDGNTDDGDCCSAICQLDGAGTPCPDDGDPCFDDVCNGTGQCTHPANTAPCDDGNACTTDDACNLGECEGTAVVCPVACEGCDPANGTCVPRPRPSCRNVAVPGKAKLQLRDLGPGESHKLIWKWLKGETTPLNAFGDPLTTDDYTLCLYGEGGPSPVLLGRAAAPAGGTCGNRSCWKATGEKGFKYKDPERTPDGIGTLVLKSGNFLGRARIIAKAQGDNLVVPPLPLALPARMQLHAEDGACWEATYSTAGVLKSDDTVFKGAGQ